MKRNGEDAPARLETPADAVGSSGVTAPNRCGSTPRNREVLGIEAFTVADAEAVRQAVPAAESAAFDHELTPDT